MANANLQFRTATPDDAPQLQQLIQAAFRVQDSRKDWIDDLGLSSSFTIGVEQILPTITNPDGAFLVATDDNAALVGCMGVAKKGDDGARLFMLAVDQKYQCGGLGRQVLAYAEDYCGRTWDVKKLGLNALSVREALISWYMRRGYRKTGELTPFPARHIDGVALPDDLCFVEMEKDLEPAAKARAE
ncbi:hypothetical protein ACJ41O_012271 [Fusarium nematophilum]